MNKKYWKSFYKNKHIASPTPFAKFVLKYLKKEHPNYNSIIDLGCGNGRDTYYFGKMGYNIIGIDSANKPKDKKNIIFKQMDLKEFFLNINNYDVVYSRFFIHSITNKEIDLLLDWAKNLFVAEFRAKEDIPILFKKHNRNKIDGNKFLKTLINKNYEILYYTKSKNLAKYKNENPIIIRVIAEKLK